MKHLEQKERDQVYNLLQRQSDRFQLEGDELSTTNITEHRILTVDDHPVNVKRYGLPHSLREEVDKQISELPEKVIVRPSKSPRWRVVIDFRPLNEKTIRVAYPLPNITDIHLIRLAMLIILR